MLDIVKKGVGPDCVSSKCPNADIWIKKANGQLTITEFPPIKAHTTKRDAETNGDSITDWFGNRCADAYCKQLAKQMAEADPTPLQLALDRKRYRDTMARISLVMQWAFRHRSQYATGRN